MLGTWSDQARVCWGKVGESGRWLLVVQHLEDSTGIMAGLWQFQPSGPCYSSGLRGEETARAFEGFIAGKYDAGKISLQFAH
ncbi:hypothetical protein E5345_11110 [Propionibacterium sp. NM47_B9-13]|jgi:hypothetical protein|uniref:HD Cas3-type domain-containing protein n=2 Tax=Cutibacterium modestum TaxID=2559073 RepID=A0AAD1KNL7_9ACTN|nr:HD domain-containing protein [Cutibacterium modestum]TGY28017.1 hypothetical protein E5345_11110 [Propionibacterium sp. NM47_B9-13]AOH46405.1 hypothetical protein BCB70_11360 [Cutibacterium modestum]EFS74283.1 hypothetical protein HMPREF9621_01314 [Cutibacterium modestum HL037PA2]EFS91911.1 hypothetical protein HMPREF9607_01884 [Cutibacterium modestum HL044PA1]EFT16177.1 hypothetical protein HMPREF9622_00738 [Cutibacterium modestum HL037PA3]